MQILIMGCVRHLKSYDILQYGIINLSETCPCHMTACDASKCLLSTGGAGIHSFEAFQNTLSDNGYIGKVFITSG